MITVVDGNVCADVFDTGNPQSIAASNAALSNERMSLLLPGHGSAAYGRHLVGAIRRIFVLLRPPVKSIGGAARANDHIKDAPARRLILVKVARGAMSPSSRRSQ
ncbi:MAG: hypothetical protein IT537_25525 [Hyphomicrobiales bacterium]|nr:hypothetical protein [Hyphomicrobiales bacterium]